MDYSFFRGQGRCTNSTNSDDRRQRRQDHGFYYEDQKQYFYPRNLGPPNDYYSKMPPLYDYMPNHYQVSNFI